MEINFDPDTYTRLHRGVATADPSWADSQGRIHDVVMMCNDECSWRYHTHTWQDALRAVEDHRAKQHNRHSPPVTMESISVNGVAWLGVMRRMEDLLVRLDSDPETWIPERTIDLPGLLVAEMVEDGRVKRFRGYLGHPTAKRLPRFKANPERVIEAMRGHIGPFTSSDVADVMGISVADARAELEAALKVGVIRKSRSKQHPHGHVIMV